MVPGAPGENGPSVPGPVVEELRPGREFVTVQQWPTVVQNVRGIAFNRDSATLTNVAYQVQIKVIFFCRKLEFCQN